MDALARLIYALPGFLLAISIHEAAHAWAAYRLGDWTAKSQGRISLDPRRHLDPLGTLMFVISSLTGFIIFGWAKPVPVNPATFRSPRRDFALTSLAGPLSNILQAYAWYGLFLLFLLSAPTLGLSDGFFAFFIKQILFFGVLINIVLFCFNLVPIPPLDGSRLLAWILPEHYAQKLDRLEPFGFIILLLLLVSGIFSLIFGPIFNVALRLFPGLMTLLHYLG